MGTQITNGSIYRSLINDLEIKNERSVSFEPDEIKIIIYTNYFDYKEWLKRKGENVNFKLTNTDIDIRLIIKHVILSVKLEDVVEVVLRLISPELNEEMKNIFT